MTQPLIVTYRPEHYSSEQRTYVVLGAPRGGTSMVAGALEILGVPMGSVNDQHEDPIFHDESNVDRMIKTIGARNRKYIHWGWKLPNTIYYYDRLASYVVNPVFVVIYRNPLSIFMSATEKDGIALTDPAFNAPVYHYARMHQLIHDHGDIPVHVMAYEAVRRSPDRFVRELSKLLPTSSSAEAQEACRAFIDNDKGYKPLPPKPASRFGALLSRRPA